MLKWLRGLNHNGSCAEYARRIREWEVRYSAGLIDNYASQVQLRAVKYEDPSSRAEGLLVASLVADSGADDRLAASPAAGSQADGLLAAFPAALSDGLPGGVSPPPPFLSRPAPSRPVNRFHWWRRRSIVNFICGKRIIEY